MRKALLLFLAALPNVSNLHMMLGHLMEWFYSGLGGIYQADHSTGYRQIILAPKPVGNIKWSKCSFKSPAGLVVSDWVRDESSFSWKIEVPETSSAKIIIPDEYLNSALEVINLENQELLDIEINEGAFPIESGKYKILLDEKMI